MEEKQSEYRRRREKEEKERVVRGREGGGGSDSEGGDWDGKIRERGVGVRAGREGGRKLIVQIVFGLCSCINIGMRILFRHNFGHNRLFKAVSIMPT